MSAVIKALEKEGYVVENLKFEFEIFDREKGTPYVEFQPMNKSSLRLLDYGNTDGTLFVRAKLKEKPITFLYSNDRASDKWHFIGIEINGIDIGLNAGARGKLQIGTYPVENEILKIEGNTNQPK